MKYLFILLIANMFISCNEKIPKISEEYKLIETLMLDKPQKFTSNLHDTISIVSDSNNNYFRKYSYFGGDESYVEACTLYYSILKSNHIIGKFKVVFFAQYSENSPVRHCKLDFVFQNYSFEISDFKGFSTLTTNFKSNMDTVWLAGDEFINTTGYSEIQSRNTSECPIIIKTKAGFIQIKLFDRIYSRIKQ